MFLPFSRKLAQYADQGDPTPYMEGSQYSDERSNHHQITPSQHSRPNSPSAAEVYQHHVQQQKQRLRYRPQMRREQREHNPDDEAATEPEWITSSLEADKMPKDPLDQDEEQDVKILPHDNEDSLTIKEEKHSNDATPEHPKMKALKRKTSKEEHQERSPKSEINEEFVGVDTATVPQTVEEMEAKQQQTKEKATTNASASSSSSSTSSSSPSTSSSISNSGGPAAHKSSTASATSSNHSHHHSTTSSSSASTSTSAASTSSSSTSSSNHHSSSSHGHHNVPPPPQSLPHPHHHYGKYVPDGYLINEHGILMTHDFIHAPTATIPTSAAASASNGNNAEDYSDVKMDEFGEADLRLTTEEMSQWQDVIKMDDYLAKGRRPQFWEEPFTRRVSLERISNRLNDLNL